MTLAECIARYEARQAAERPQIALTPRGAAVRAVYSLRAQMAALEPAERAEIISLIVAELEIPAV